jgi:hypothetical protein
MKQTDAVQLAFKRRGRSARAAQPGQDDRLGGPGLRLPVIRRQDLPVPSVVTTCGATWMLSKFVGEPGRRIILRGIRSLCHPLCRTSYTAHYKMDSSTPESRARYLQKVGRKIGKL